MAERTSFPKAFALGLSLLAGCASPVPPPLYRFVGYDDVSGYRLTVYRLTVYCGPGYTTYLYEPTGYRLTVPDTVPHARSSSTRP